MRYKLKLKRLDFVSPVDTPAQQTARVLLIKRDRQLSGFARAVKVSDELGLVFCWAFTSKASGADYYDLQDDNIDEDFIKAAADFMQSGGATDEMHDGRPDGRVVFAFPMTAEIAKAFGIETETTGLMVALKPSDDVLAKFKSGEYTGVSIEGVGERTKVAAARKDADGDDDGGSGDDDMYKCADCGQYMKADDEACKECGGSPMKMKRASVFDADGSLFLDAALEQPIRCVKIGKRAPVHYKHEQVRKATWSTAVVDDLPDSSFLYIEGGGKKDDQGKTTPRSLRHFPYKDENGKVDLPHLRDAIDRIPQSSLPATLRNKLQVKAEKLLAAQHDKDSNKRVGKRAFLTTAAAGHTHLINDGDDGSGPQTYGNTDYAAMPGVDGGGYHCHPWVLADDGTMVIGEAEGHDHRVLDVNATDGDDDEDDASAGKRASNSTPRNPVDHAGHTPRNNMDELKKQLAEALAKIADLQKRDERLAKMSAAHRAHWAGLSGDAAEMFLAKSDADRDAALADVAKRNEVEYTADDGAVYRKGDDPRLVALAKSNDANARKAADVELTKRAEGLGMPGSLEVRKFFLKAADGCADEKLKPLLHAALKASADATQRLFNATDHKLRDGFELPANGSDPEHGGAVDSPSDALRKHVEKYQADNKIPTYQQAFAKALADDAKTRELYAAVKN